MKFTLIPIYLLTIALLGGCARMKVSSKTDPAYDFNRITTYQWIDTPNDILEQDDTYLNINMQKALNNELATRGWKQVLDAAEASVQVTYYFKTKTHQEVSETAPEQESEFSGGVVFDRSKREWNYKKRKPEQIVYMIETGTLHFIMNDAQNGKCIWRGMLQTEIDRSQPPEKRNELFRQIARKLFQELTQDVRK